MSLQDKLADDLKQAMRERDENRKIALRLLRAGIVNEEVEKGHRLDDAEVMAVAARQAKQRRDSIEAFRAGGREDLVAQEEAQLRVLQDYLPQQMSREEIEQAARESIARTGAAGPAGMGAVMRDLMPRLKGKAEGSLVSQVVKELLSAQ
ncbi:MAG TPA: GatB/YqeY domain-containing protein [Anaerolineae bacterium]|nr:GatB/YqeY domain-containing protein [Anaerolineae bacterium]HOQ97546.1 GatB/YqeY domain-containing protein [Anaerolineae bacterium]HPL28370.1 GatB/YqeY domain-containing protein [Anaerolineae bacterium]